MDVALRGMTRCSFVDSEHDLSVRAAKPAGDYLGQDRPSSVSIPATLHPLTWCCEKSTLSALYFLRNAAIKIRIKRTS